MNWLPIIMALGYGLGGQALGGTAGAIAGTGLGLLGGSYINKQRELLNVYGPNPPYQGQISPVQKSIMGDEMKRLDNIYTLALLLSGLGAGYFMGGQNFKGRNE